MTSTNEQSRFLKSDLSFECRSLLRIFRIRDSSLSTALKIFCNRVLSELVANFLALPFVELRGERSSEARGRNGVLMECGNDTGLAGVSSDISSRARVRLAPASSGTTLLTQDGWNDRRRGSA